LQQDGLTFNNGSLNLLEEVSILGISNNKMITAHPLNPLISLVLGINVEGPSETLSHENTILSREIVCGQAVSLPISSLRFTGQELSEFVVFAVSDFLFPDLFDPHRVKFVSVVRGEGAAVRHKRGSKQAVTK
jgi:hypothetical protein